MRTIKVYRKQGFEKNEIAILKIKEIASLDLAMIQYKIAYPDCSVYHSYDLSNKESELIIEG